MSLRGKYEESHVVVKIIQWLGCIFLFSIPSMGSIFFFPQPLSVSSLKWVQLIQMSAMFLLPPLCMAYLWSKYPLQWLQVEHYKLNRKRDWLWAVGIMLLALPAINLLGSWNQQMTLPAFLEPLETWMKTKEETATQLTDQFMNVTTWGGLVINLLLMAGLPALAEELTFRGVLYRLFSGKSVDGRVPHMAIWCTAILFSAIHMQFYGFVPRMLMGALFGYALAWTGSLWTPIVMHFTNNAMAVLLYFVAVRAGWDIEAMDTIGTNDTLWLGVVSLLVTIVGIYAFRRSTTMSSASSRMSNGN